MYDVEFEIGHFAFYVILKSNSVLLDVVPLFKQEHQKLIKYNLEEGVIDWDRITFSLAENVKASILFSLVREWACGLEVWAHIKHIDKLIQVFADEDVKNKIRKEVFSRI